MLDRGTLGGRRQRGRRYDVVFYSPSIGSILSRTAKLPPGGAETQILLLARQLAAQRLRVAIIVFGDPSELPAEVDGVTIVQRARYRGGQRLVGRILEGISIWRALARAPSESVVHRCAGAELATVGLYTRLSRRRLVYSSASVVDFAFHKIEPRWRNRLLFSLGIRLADTIVVQTEEQVELCRERFAREPALIRSLCEAPAEQQCVPQAFLWVGRLTSDKRPLAYLELARAVPEARFWMIGVGGEPKLVSEVSRQSKAIENLELLAPRPRVAVQELMARAVASVNTAEFEGMPNVLLEAWAQGVPALTLHHDPDGVIARHRLGGYADGSPERLVELARELWQNRRQRAELAARCRAYVEQAHSPHIVAGQWRQVLVPCERSRSALDAELESSVGQPAHSHELRGHA